MNKIERSRISICLALLGIGILLLGAWDMQHVSAAPGPEAWSRGADLPLPDSFYGSTQCQGDPNGFYIVAGWQAWFDNRDEVWHYDAATSDWTELAPYPEEMGMVSVVCYQGFLYGAGGNQEGWSTSNHFYRYDINAGTWEQLADLPRPQNGAALAAWDGYLYMIGGDDAAVVPISPTRQVDRYNLQTGTWEMSWGTLMPVEVIASWVQSGQYVYFVGGYTSNFPNNSDATLRYDLVTNTWETGPSFASRRAVADIVITSQYLYAIGGDANLGGSADETDLVERLELSLWPAGDWVDTGDPLPEPRAASGGFCSKGFTGGEIWSVGGGGTSDEPTVETYYRSSEECAKLYFGDWVESEPIPEPLAANLVQCSNDTDSFYLLGGVMPGNYSSDQFRRYDVATAEWEQLEAMPGARRAVAAACYQGKIYAAGGSDESNFIRDTLFIYDIISDSWTIGPPMPDPVFGASMGAWDGKVYVVGGSQVGIPFYTPVPRVDVLDLNTGIWTPNGGTPMPNAASFFGSVQTGPYLYVVGGASGDFMHNVNQTQRYNMATDEWQIGPQFTSARALASLAASSSHLYALGGDMDGGALFDVTDQVEFLDLSTWPSGTWTELDDPLPQPIIYPASTCSEALTGGEIWAVGGGDENLQPFDTNYYRPIGEPCVSFGADLPEPWTESAEPGTIVIYTIELTNTGVVTDYYTLEVSSTWHIGTPLGGPGPIGPGEGMDIAITVEVPFGAMWGDYGETEITATSMSNPAATDSTTITTRVLGYQFDLQPVSPDSFSAHPGEVVTYTLQVSNIGDFEDTYTVTASANWGTITPIMVGPTLPGEDTEMLVTVEIPPDAQHGDQDEAEIALTSKTDPRVSHTITLTSTALWHRMLMPLALKN